MKVGQEALSRRLRVGWCILRTSGRRTLPLAQSLANEGFDVWTPAATYRIRIPRANAKRETTLPLMATFVFARSHHVQELLERAAREEFTVFHYLNRIPIVSDQDLEPLRTAERRVLPVSKQRRFRAGETVRVPTGSFAGMAGVVQGSDGRYTLVSFGSKIRVKISTFLLLPDSVDISQPYDGSAAQAA